MMRRIIKSAVVRLALFGLLPYSAADYLIKHLNLGAA